MFGPRSTVTVYTRSPAVQARADRRMAAACREAIRNGSKSGLRHWGIALKR